MNTAAGVLIGLVASAISGVTAFWWKSRRDLKTAAAQCFDRLLKLQQAEKLSADERTEVIAKETYLLGAHMDLYLAAIGSVVLPRWRRRYWAAYKGMVPVLISKDLTHLDVTIDRLAPLVKAATGAEAKPPDSDPPV
jgi:hypothetical protein